MPDTSTAWEDITLPLAYKVGINSTDASQYTTDPIPATDEHLIAAKGMLRTRVIICAGSVVGKYNDREEFFDAIAALAATDTDPLYDDLRTALAWFWWVHYYESQHISEDDRMWAQKMAAMKEGELAAKALCKTIGFELGQTRIRGGSRSRATSSRLNAYSSTITNTLPRDGSI